MYVCVDGSVVLEFDIFRLTHFFVFAVIQTAVFSEFKSEKTNKQKKRKGATTFYPGPTTMSQAYKAASAYRSAKAGGGVRRGGRAKLDEEQMEARVLRY